MAGVGEGGGPPQPLHPKEHMSTWGGSPSSHVAHPPQHQTKGEAPPPRATPHPNLGCTFSGFQQSYGSGGHGVGEVAHQS